jgi:hypothetical protein
MKNLITTIGGILLEVAFTCAIVLGGFLFSALLGR